jgi:putative transposase
MSRNISFGVDEFYHTYNRGIEKRLIFNDQSDRDRFLNLLFLANSSQPIEYKRDHKSDGGLASVTFDPKKQGETLVNIGAYCLMPNHFHLLVREKTEKGLSTFMHKLLTAYTMYFNRKYKRTGSLFETTFKAKHADNDNYLHYLFAYIHLNPIKIAFPAWPEAEITNMIEVEKHLTNYRFSSYLDHASQEPRSEGLILNKQVFPEYFQKTTDFSSFLADWIRYQKIEE